MSGTQTGAGGESPLSRPTPLELVAPPILTLETIDPEPRSVRIDGASYLLRAYDDLSVFEHARLSRLTRRADEATAFATAEDGDDYTAEQIAALDASLHETYNQMTRIVVPDVPAETIAALSTEKKRQIQMAFYDALAERNARAAAAPARPTGAWSSLRSALGTATGSIGRFARRCADSSPRIAISRGSPRSTR